MTTEKGARDPPKIPERVLLISLDNPSKNGGVGGKHTHIRLLMDGLQKAGWQAACVSAPDDPFFKAFHLLPGSIARRFIDNKDERYCHWFRQVRRSMERNLSRYDLDYPVCNPQDVISFLDSMNVLKGNQPEIKSVLTLHGYYADEMISVGSVTKDSPTALRMKRAELKAYEQADRIVCVDTRIKGYVEANAKVKNEVAVIPNAIDVDRFKPIGKEDISRLKSDLHFQERDGIILCARRLVPKNGVGFLVSAMPKILKQIPDAVLVVAGDGPQRNEIDSKIADLGISSHVRMLGSLPHEQMMAYTQIADVEVVPSVISNNVQEATSLAMLEGMSCGKPTVVSSIGGLKETITDGKTGLFAEQGDPGDLADKVIQVMSDRELAQAMGAKAREYVVEKHSHLAHAKQFIEQYRMAIG